MYMYTYTRVIGAQFYSTNSQFYSSWVCHYTSTHTQPCHGGITLLRHWATETQRCTVCERSHGEIHMNDIHIWIRYIWMTPFTHMNYTYEWHTRVKGVIHMYLIHMYLWIRYIWMTPFTRILKYSYMMVVSIHVHFQWTWWTAQHVYLWVRRECVFMSPPRTHMNCATFSADS